MLCSIVGNLKIVSLPKFELIWTIGSVSRMLLISPNFSLASGPRPNRSGKKPHFFVNGWPKGQFSTWSCPCCRVGDSCYVIKSARCNVLYCLAHKSTTLSHSFQWKWSFLLRGEQWFPDLNFIYCIFILFASDIFYSGLLLSHTYPKRRKMLFWRSGSTAGAPELIHTAGILFHHSPFKLDPLKPRKTTIKFSNLIWF